MPSGIVYGLAQHDLLKVYLPAVYVVGIERAGKLGYMERKGTREVLESYSFYDPDGPHQKALDLCDELTPEALQQRFVKSKRLSLAKALEDKLIKQTVLAAIGKKMDQLLTEIVKHDFNLCLDVDRKEYLEDLRIQPSDDYLVPKLHFLKSDEGIDYTLAIRNKNIQWYPSERDVTLICDRPGWIIEQKKLYRLQCINGNKIKPFLKKRVVHIPNRIAHDYLEKFVKDIISKVDVKAEGFDISKNVDAPTGELIFRKNFITEEWMMELLLHYGDEMFHYKLPDRSRTKLQYGSGSDVSFSLIERDDLQEQDIINLLEDQGLSLDADKRLRVKGSSGEDPFDTILWMRDNRDKIGSDLVKMTMPILDDHQLNVGKPSIHISQVENNDWFDIYGVVKIDRQEVFFKELIDCIRQEERVFKLPDGTCFIIPLEWMTKYSSLARWAKDEGDGIKILRSQYTLMEDAQQEEGQSMAVYETIDNNVDYEVSPKLQATLRPYQLEGAQWLVNHQAAQLGCCLADDMGLGKTLQTLCALLYAKEHKEDEPDSSNQLQLNLFEAAIEEEIQPLRALIVMPASLIFNWFNEIKKFAPHLHVVKHMGSKRVKQEQVLRNNDVVLTSYQTALRDVGLLEKIEWTYIVLDESQYIKNHNSKIFGAIQDLQSRYKLSLSGTPIENSLSDLWAQMQFINPDILGTYPFFKKQFQIPIEKYRDEGLLDELVRLTNPYILRRTKEQVLKDLPEKTEQVIYCDMTKEQKSIYEREKSAARNLLLEGDVTDPQVKMQIFTSLLRLRQLSNHPVLYKKEYKHDAGKFEILRENLLKVKKANHKALIFSSFTGHLDIVATYLNEKEIPYVMLTGKTSQKDRQAGVDLFQSDEKLPFFLISIKAGGTGLNLTAADYVFILDPWWNPFAENQAIARAHRIGLDHPLAVQRYITTDSIEEKIMKLQAKKKALSEDILGAKETPDWSKEELNYILA